MVTITASSTLEDVAAIVSSSLEQAIFVAVNNEINWKDLRVWFKNEGEPDVEFERFRAAVRALGST